MEKYDLRAILGEIADLLEAGEPDPAAVTVRAALSGSEEKVEEFLLSNELWGGAGSIADQSLISNQARRKALENALIRLGRLQIASGRTNRRTEMWVAAFEQYRSRTDSRSNTCAPDNSD
jgi:hypothetical protein